jgi:hypothetical protein
MPSIKKGGGGWPSDCDRGLVPLFKLLIIVAYPRRVQSAERHGDCAEDFWERENNGWPDRKQPQNDLRLNNNGYFFNVQAERLS